MKRFLNIAILTVLLLTAFTSGNMVLAQRMASESHSPWNEADDTGYYSIIRCDICGEFIASYSAGDEIINVNEHNEAKHSEKTDNSESGNDGNSSSNDPTNFYYTNIVNINNVAYSLQRIGVCNAQWFIDEYNSYYSGYIDQNNVDIYSVNSLIRQSFRLDFNISLKEAVLSHRTFIALLPPNSGSLYTVIDSKTTSSYKYTYEDKFLYVFTNSLFNKRYTKESIKN